VLPDFLPGVFQVPHQVIDGGSQFGVCGITSGHQSPPANFSAFFIARLWVIGNRAWFLFSQNIINLGLFTLIVDLRGLLTFQIMNQLVKFFLREGQQILFISGQTHDFASSFTQSAKCG
jgi:hypothetical protein